MESVSFKKGSSHSPAGQKGKVYIQGSHRGFVVLVQRWGDKSLNFHSGSGKGQDREIQNTTEEN